jgi:DNA-binding IclR family transcriptional regulator
MVQQVRERSGAQAVERAVRVMDCFANDQPELSLSEVARGCGLPVSTTHRITQALVRGGLLERSGRDRYRVGQRLAVLAAPVLVRLGVDRAAPYLYKLAEGLKLTASLGTQDDGELLTVVSARPTGDLCPIQVPGPREPLHASAMGKALLAFAPGGPRAAVDALGQLGRFTGRTLTSRENLIADLLDVRRRGFARSDEELIDGVRAVAVPILGARGQTWGALGVQARTRRLTEGKVTEIVPALRYIGDEIGRRVGTGKGAGS